MSDVGGCWNASALRPCASVGTVSGRSPGASGGRRRRCRGSCAATSSHTTKVSMTPISLTPVPVTTPAANAQAHWLSSQGCGTWSRTNWRTPGVRSRSVRGEYPNRPEWHICHETIYQAVYLGRKGGLSRTLTAKLRTGRPLRKRRRKATERTPRYIAPAVLIHRRPPIVEARTRIGDWEGDLIV